MALDFKSLLSKPLAEVKRPPALPAGPMHGIVANYKIDESRFPAVKDDPSTKYAVVVWTVKLTEPAEGSAAAQDPSLLQFEGAPLDLNRRPHTIEMPLSGGNEFVTKEFLEKLGVTTEGRSWSDALPDAVNAQVTCDVTQREDTKNPGVYYNDIRYLRPRT